MNATLTSDSPLYCTVGSLLFRTAVLTGAGALISPIVGANPGVGALHMGSLGAIYSVVHITVIDRIGLNGPEWYHLALKVSLTSGTLFAAFSLSWAIGSLLGSPLSWKQLNGLASMSLLLTALILGCYRVVGAGVELLGVNHSREQERVELGLMPAAGELL